LHSTPQQELFRRARRDFSHGCIRVEDPVALAEFVLNDQARWDKERIRRAMNGGASRRVNLDKLLPVLIFYTTAVVEPDNTVYFYDDVYGHDATLDRVLLAGYPYAP
jgi:murein L,D-transpeptidase YcbB/YkuD